MPDLVTTLITAPPARPYSAENAFELTWNSFTASWLNWYGARPDPVRPSVWPKNVLLLSAPSTTRLFSVPRWPAKLMSPVRTSRVTPGVEQREVDEVAAVDRQVLHGEFCDRRAHLGSAGFDHRRAADDIDRFGNSLHRHLNAQGERLPNGQPNVGLLAGGEPGQLGGELVDTDRQEQQPKPSFGVGRSRPGEPGAGLDHGDRHARQDRAGLIDNRSLDRARGTLRDRASGGAGERQHGQQGDRQISAVSGDTMHGKPLSQVAATVVDVTEGI